ncbi:hypothetical protein [Stenotrophomonas sp. GZD-301]|uniref:hypothetical protein n=1 Tax=Stenotrophomonas sp. GZD-301 TaxID=3404814 RepID=UPI003BB663FB
MSEIETRARELLNAHMQNLPGAPWKTQPVQVYERALSAMIDALTPPEGYVPATAVLGTATRLRRLASAASPLGRKAYIKAAEEIEMTVSAARPEVTGG